MYVAQEASQRRTSVRMRAEEVDFAAVSICGIGRSRADKPLMSGNSATRPLKVDMVRPWTVRVQQTRVL